MAQLMPLPLTVSCFSKIQIGFTFVVSAHLGSPGKRAVKRVCVCVCVTANSRDAVLCRSAVGLPTVPKKATTNFLRKIWYQSDLQLVTAAMR